MSIYGSVGYTRRDKTPKHWQKDYRLTQKTKKAIQEIKAERERLFQELESLPLEISDKEYNEAENILKIKLDELIKKEDKIRLINPKWGWKAFFFCLILRDNKNNIPKNYIKNICTVKLDYVILSQRQKTNKILRGRQ